MLDMLDKGTTVEQNIEAVEFLKSVGIKTFATVMTALPGETLDEVGATVKMIQTTQPEHYMIFFYQPIPGTTLGDRCFNEGIVLREDPLQIERSFKYEPTIKGPDYPAIMRLLQGEVS